MGGPCVQGQREDQNRLPLADQERNPTKQSVNGDNPNKNAHPLTSPTSRIPKRLEDTRPRDLALGRQLTLVHAVAAGSAVEDTFFELVDHHTLEDVRLVVDVVEDVLPKDVQDGWGDHEAANAHPEAVQEGG